MKSDRFDQLNPWLRVWIEPGPASMQLLHTQSVRRLIWIILASPFATALQQFIFSWIHQTTISKNFLVRVMIISLVLSALGFWVGSSLFYTVGRKSNGKGSKERVRVGFLINIALLLVISPILFVMIAISYTSLKLVSLLLIPLYLWIIFIELKVLANAHSFSIWDALTTVVLSILVIAIPMCCLVFFTTTLIPWNDLFSKLFLK